MGNFYSSVSKEQTNEVQSASMESESASTTTSINDNSGIVTTKTLPIEIVILQERRKKILSEKKKEFEQLREQLQIEKAKNDNLLTVIENKNMNKGTSELHVKISELAAENAVLKGKVVEFECREAKESLTSNEKNRKLQMEIANMQKELQTLNGEIVAFEKEKEEYNSHIIALKDVINVSKQLLEIRQNQIVQLNAKNEHLQKALTDKDIITYSNEIREEYEKQLKNIKDLRILYEQRQAAAENAKEQYKIELENCQKDLTEEKSKSEELSKRVEELEKDNSEKYDKIANLELSTKMKKVECNELQAQLAVINRLFSEIILGIRNGHEIDMDKLIYVLEENHDLLTNIVVNEESNEVSSTLPKVLLDLINRVQTRVSDEENSEGNGSITNSDSDLAMKSAAEIVEKLPKVWRVLAELLSHQEIPVNALTSDETTEQDPCYKSVQTPTGPRLVLSVSGTYIKLKDLILEKKSLEKETFHLKQLNTHLETRLQDQEKRLEMVSAELSKTWHVVGKMQKQHELLHTQEKILRYELAQKRKLLTNLKEELEYCREKWVQAREKNNKTELEWKELRNEFASRKTVVNSSLINDDNNNSIESGFSDDRETPSSSEDEKIEENDEEHSEGGKNGTGPPTVLAENSKSEIEETYKRLESDILETVAKAQMTDMYKNSSLPSTSNQSLERERPEQLKLKLFPAHVSEAEVMSPRLQAGSLTEIPDHNGNFLIPSPSCSSHSREDGGEEEEAIAPSTSEDRNSPNKMLATREERLRKLEEQCKQLTNKILSTSNRGCQMYRKLSDLHEKHGANNVTSQSGSSSTEDTDNEE